MGVEATVFKGSPSGAIIESTYRHPDPLGTQVLVRITHSGICGTDEHFKRTDMVLGHEGVGIVAGLGEEAAKAALFQVGDVVGWGFTHRVCGRCTECLTGNDQYCPTRERFGVANKHQGSYGTHAVWDSAFLFHVPEGMAPEDAGPLMCGGATVFNIIESYNVRPTERVGVVGIGGLGHLAIQFLAKMGCTVVVFSSSDSKRDEAQSLGAAEFIATKGLHKFEVRPLNRLIVTTSFQPEWKPYIAIMAPRSSIHPLTVERGTINLPLNIIVNKGITIQPASVAARSVHQKMLEFAAKHQIKPIIEQFPMSRDGVEEGLKRLREGKMRYRGVLVNSKL